MKNSLRQFGLIPFLFFVFAIVACCKDPIEMTCPDIPCPSGQVCQDGECVDEPSTDKIPGFLGVSSAQMILRQSSGWDRGAKMTPNILLHDDTLRLWYTGFEEYPRGKTGIGYSWSTNGTSWTWVDKPVVSEQKQIGGPVVIWDEDHYKMWYVNNFPCIGGCKYSMRTSMDGVNWDEPMDVSIPLKSWAQPMLVPHSAIKEDGIYKMWVTGNENPPGSDNNFPKIGYATSSDGLQWDLLDQPVLVNGAQGDFDHSIADWPAVFKHGGEYHMYYRGDQNVGASPGDSYTLYATSPDGITWEKYEFNPVLRAVSWARDDLHATSAAVFGDKIFLVYSAYIVVDGATSLAMGVTFRDIE